MSKAEEYVASARGVINNVLTHHKGAELWWQNETQQRRDVGLSQIQRDELRDLLRQRFPRADI